MYSPAPDNRGLMASCNKLDPWVARKLRRQGYGEFWAQASATRVVGMVSIGRMVVNE